MNGKQYQQLKINPKKKTFATLRSIIDKKIKSVFIFAKYPDNIIGCENVTLDVKYYYPASDVDLVEDPLNVEGLQKGLNDESRHINHLANAERSSTPAESPMERSD